MEIPESQDSRDARIQQLWQKLDPQKKGELDLTGLRKGLSRIDHPLKNADDILKDIVKAMDKNGDQVIQYEEFRTFVVNTERELLSLFESIDKDHNGKIDKDELKAAFKKAGLVVPNSKLNKFFSEVDQNKDVESALYPIGTYDSTKFRSSGDIKTTSREGREKYRRTVLLTPSERFWHFLLFLPTHTETPELKAVLSYYSSTITLNSEGDSNVSEETLEGLGRTRFSFIISALIGSLFEITATLPSKRSRPSPSPEDLGIATVQDAATGASIDGTMLDPNRARLAETTLKSGLEALPQPNGTPSTNSTIQQQELSGLAQVLIARNKKSFLQEITPDPGYFLAGGIAGAISRTCTAPLDRLKVYLIANISTPAKETVDAVKKGNAATAAKHIGRPLVDATKELWKAGGMRSLFAGNGLNVVKVMPESAIKFGSYEATKRALAQLEGHGDPKKINPYSQFVAGGVGGMVSQLCVYPIDTLKFRMQCETVKGGLHGNALIIATAKKMYKQGGIRSAYRGLTMGLVGMFPYSAIDLGTFEYLKSSIAARKLRMGYSQTDSAPGSFATGCIGALSGSLGASVVYPINLLRTRLQAQGTVLHPPTYEGIWDVAQKTVKNEGVQGLFKGITPNLLKVVPAVSITYVVYEKSKHILQLEE
ncbi:Calcium-binding mitochondrial carrier [Lachnellula hyalina]|uniref:Mitochondrial thiamine pyrophosphate carrier 1 n=1 Tax=Lachnellula hyalina TaxID=1316788 RepID=A0A8H8TVI8_9HELO|nr:Calcium-binding mitochondrial carrier [Lachnellula hyalina]TVY23412.1 Calcium-binding mitochondrial carrier [Lachnellula hyalina]